MYMSKLKIKKAYSLFYFSILYCLWYYVYNVLLVIWTWLNCRWYYNHWSSAGSSEPFTVLRRPLSCRWLFIVHWIGTDCSKWYGQVDEYAWDVSDRRRPSGKVTANQNAVDTCTTWSTPDTQWSWTPACVRSWVCDAWLDSVGRENDSYTQRTGSQIFPCIT